MKTNIRKQIGTVPQCTLLPRDQGMVLGTIFQAASNSWKLQSQKEALIPTLWCFSFWDSVESPPAQR